MPAVNWLAIIAATISAFVLTGLELGLVLAYSLAAGLGWSAFGLGIIALFERRPPACFLVNGAYLTATFLLMGLILGRWR